MSIHPFDPNDRFSPLKDIVSAHGVPMVRAWALILWQAEQHGAKVSVASAIRVDSIIEEHNRRFHTDLHGQQYLVDAHARDPAHFAAANSPSTTSHCWFSDGSAVYRTSRGVHIPAGGRLPWYGHGIDVDDLGKIENNTHLLATMASLGYHAVRPYSAGSETHHLVLVTDPTHALIEHGPHLRTLRPRHTSPGRDVLHAQRMLKHLGYLAPAHKIGNHYGVPAMRAVKRFKSDHNLPKDSVLGPNAWKRLEVAYHRKGK